MTTKKMSSDEWKNVERARGGERPYGRESMSSSHAAIHPLSPHTKPRSVYLSSSLLLRTSLHSPHLIGRCSRLASPTSSWASAGAFQPAHPSQQPQSTSSAAPAPGCPPILPIPCRSHSTPAASSTMTRPGCTDSGLRFYRDAAHSIYLCLFMKCRCLPLLYIYVNLLLVPLVLGML